jgi:hypothetical protein
MTPSILRSLEAHGLSSKLRRNCVEACRRNWGRRHDQLIRGQIRRDLAILKWGRA